MSSNSYLATQLPFFIVIIIAIAIANFAQTENCPAYYFLCMRPTFTIYHIYKKTNSSWLTLHTTPYRIREAIKYYLADFFMLRRYPPPTHTQWFIRGVDQEIDPYQCQ